MTEDEAIRLLDALPGEDPEAEHGTADGIAWELLPERVRDAIARAEHRAGGWWWA